MGRAEVGWFGRRMPQTMRCFSFPRVRLALAWLLALWATWAVAQPAAEPSALVPEGVVFHCAPAQRAGLARAMAGYLRGLDVDRDWIVQTEWPDGALSFTLDRAGRSTLDLHQDRRYRLRSASVYLPRAQGRSRAVRTVSQREIVLALAHPGRAHHFGGPACDLQALREHVALRQHIVAWAEELHWVWPDGGPACWNPKKWLKGVPIVPLDEALLDAFVRQADYAIGCYTASKLVYAHAVLDYYARVRQDPAQAALVRQRLLHDGDPLVGVEPAAAWDFEAGFDPATRHDPGKLLRLERGAPAHHFVPGDWAYFLNTDPASYEKTGYEGSNAIYLGRGRFDDFYDDHHHAYTFAEKLDEVYQWRHGVFSRSRDAALVRPLTPADLDRLSQPPAQGGLLLDWRLVPYLFGYEALPALPVR